MNQTLEESYKQAQKVKSLSLTFRLALVLFRKMGHLHIPITRLRCRNYLKGQLAKVNLSNLNAILASVLIFKLFLSYLVASAVRLLLVCCTTSMACKFISSKKLISLP